MTITNAMIERAMEAMTAVEFPHGAAPEAQRSPAQGDYFWTLATAAIVWTFPELIERTRGGAEGHRGPGRRFLGAAARAQSGNTMTTSLVPDPTLSVYASPGCLTVSAVDGRVLAIDDPTGRLQALAIEQVDLDSVSLFPALELMGTPLDFASLGFWRRLSGRRHYTLPPLQAA
jgi:hypothetical protein